MAIPLSPSLHFTHTIINMETMHRPYRVIKKVKADGTADPTKHFAGSLEDRNNPDWSLLPSEILDRIMKNLLSGFRSPYANFIAAAQVG